MMTDDWSSGVSFEWDNIEADFDWRFTGFPTEDQPELPVLSEEEPIDIEGDLRPRFPQFPQLAQGSGH